MTPSSARGRSGRGIGLGAFARNSVWYAMPPVVAAVVGFALLPVKARYLSTSDFGLVATATALTSVLVILVSAGLSAAVGRFYFDFPEHGSAWRRFLGSAVLLSLALAVAAALLLVALGPRLQVLLPAGFRFVPYGLLVTGTVFFTPTFQIAQSLRVAERLARPYSLAATATSVIAAALTSLLLVAGLGAEGALLAQLATAGAFFALSMWWLLRQSRLAWQWSAARQALAYGLPFIPHGLSAWITSLSDRLILGKMATLSDVGVYSMGYTIASVVGMAAMAVNLAYSPVFMLRAKEDPQGSLPLFAELNTTLFAIVVAFAGIVSVYAQELVSTLATAGYKGAAAVIPVVALGMVFQGLYYIASNPIVFAKRAVKYLPLTTAAAAAVNVGLNLWLIPLLGYMGSAWATVGGFAVLFLAARYLANRYYRVPIDYLALGTITLAAVPMIACTILGSTGLLTGMFGLGVKTAAVAAFCAFVMPTRVSRLRREMG
jgi:O-antigen/teichoic acid export membrane protein